MFIALLKSIESKQPCCWFLWKVQKWVKTVFTMPQTTKITWFLLIWSWFSSSVCTSDSKKQGFLLPTLDSHTNISYLTLITTITLYLLETPKIANISNLAYLEAPFLGKKNIFVVLAIEIHKLKNYSLCFQKKI